MLNTSNQFNNNYSKKIEFDPGFKFLMNIQKKTRQAHNSLTNYLLYRVTDTETVVNSKFIQFKI